jgi:LemA protein
MLKIILSILGVICVAVAFLVISVIGSYNGLVGLSQGVDAKWAQVQTVYQRRADLIPNLVATVSGAANFEKSTLTNVTEARASVGRMQLDPNKAPSDAAQLAQYQAAQGQISSALSRLLVVSENYPDLKSNTNFRDLQAQIEGTENRISVARQDFNNVVQTYNTKVKTFPAVLIAGLMGFSPKPYFQADAGSQAAPKVNFDFGKTPAN